MRQESNAKAIQWNAQQNKHNDITRYYVVPQYVFRVHLLMKGHTLGKYFPLTNMGWTTLHKWIKA